MESKQGGGDGCESVDKFCFKISPPCSSPWHLLVLRDLTSNMLAVHFSIPVLIPQASAAPPLCSQVLPVRATFQHLHLHPCLFIPVRKPTCQLPPWVATWLLPSPSTKLNPDYPGMWNLCFLGNAVTISMVLTIK